jgi:hypothetical protein
MFCPRCSNQIAENQNYCRNCGLNVGVIVDAMQDKPRGRFDFDPVVRGLHDLGSSLRAGWEEAHNSIKNTRRLNKNAQKQDLSREVRKAVWSREVSELLKHHIDKALKKANAAHPRKRSFQQATLSIFSGGAMMAVWYYVLEAVANSGLLQNLQMIILNQTGTYINIDGLITLIRMLWLLGLIPAARGVAHLINGIFFAPGQEKELQTGLAPDFAPAPAQHNIQPPPDYVSAVDDPATNGLDSEPSPQISVTDDPTLRFEATPQK